MVNGIAAKSYPAFNLSEYYLKETLSHLGCITSLMSYHYSNIADMSNEWDRSINAKAGGITKENTVHFSSWYVRFMLAKKKSNC